MESLINIESSNYVDMLDSNMSNYVTNTVVDSFDEVDSNVSNYFDKVETNVDLLDINMSNYLKNTSNYISNRITDLDADDITQGTSHKFIVNNKHDDDLTISGTLYTSNIRAVGSNTLIFTDIYTTESLNVVSTAEDSDAFVISHSGEGQYNVMTATVADDPVFTITKCQQCVF